MPHQIRSSLERRRFLGVLGLTSLAPSLLLSQPKEEASIQKTKRSLSGRQLGYYRFRIGEFEAVALLDGCMKVPAEHFSETYCGRPKETILADLRDAMESEESLELHFNSLLVNTGKDLVLVDTGAGPLYKNKAGWHKENLEAVGVSPDDISAVLLTHADFDHFGGLLDPVTSKPVYSNARHFISRLEYVYTTNTADPLLKTLPAQLTPGREKNGVAYLKALDPRWEFIAGGDKPLPGVEVVDLPGHRPGHLGFLFANAKGQLLHFGDVFHHHVLSLAHPDWTFRSDHLPAQAIASRMKVLQLAGDGRLRLFGSHMPFPALGRIRHRTEDRFEFVRECWSAA